MLTQIDPRAFVHPEAMLYEGVQVGPFAYIGPHVKLGKGCVVAHHATIDGHTELGEKNTIHPYAYLGAQTHDLKHKGGTCFLRIGHRNVFREYVSIHTATNDGDSTLIGNDNYFLAFAHLGHDCKVENNVIVSAGAAIGGHVHLGNYSNVGGNSSIHQFCRIGAYAMLGGHSFLKKDILPFMLAIGVPANVKSFNRVGMVRRGFNERQRNWAKQLFKCLYESDWNRTQAFEQIADLSKTQEACDEITQQLFTFAKNSTRGLI